MLKQLTKVASPSHHRASDNLPEFPSSLVDCSRRMFEQQDGCDVTFLVKGPGDATEMKTGAHRYVLCSRSPVLHKVLQWGSKATADKKLKENDIPAEVFREILRYMYCDELSLTLPNAVQVLRGAHKYQLTGLAGRCQEFIAGNLTDDAVCDVLDKCLSANEQAVVDTCLRYIANHTPGVFQSPGFLQISPEVLKRIVEQDTLDVSELDLFHACVAWANHRAAVATPSSKINGAALRRFLQPIIPLIRFPTMTTSEFATFVVPLNILTDTETCNVYKYFTCPERPEKWFQTARRKRPSDRGSVTEGAGGLYPELGGAEKNPGLMPSAPDLLTGSRDDHDRPPKYDDPAVGQSCNA